MSKKVNLKPRAMMYPSPAVIASAYDEEGKATDEYTETKELETLNSMMPIWKKNKSYIKCLIKLNLKDLCLII